MNRNKALPEDLLQFAREAQLDGSGYRSRYLAILEYAFSKHILTLNAKQLRELAGGGSQTTAQEAISAFRLQVSAKLSEKIPFGDDIPEEVAAAASSAIEALWKFASAQADAQYAEDSRRWQAQIVELEQKLQAEAEALAGRGEEIAALMKQIDGARIEAATALAAAKTERDLLETEWARKSAAALEQLASERDAEKAALAGRVAELVQQLSDSRLDAQARFERLMLEHRESSASLARAHAEQVAHFMRGRDEDRANARLLEREASDLRISLALMEKRVSDITSEKQALKSELEQALRVAADVSREPKDDSSSSSAPVLTEVTPPTKPRRARKRKPGSAQSQ